MISPLYPGSISPGPLTTETAPGMSGLRAGAVVFVGVGTKFQIWDKERFAPVLARTLENARALRDSLSNGGVA